MAYDIGPKIGIDGEAEFRKQIKQISDNIKTLGSELKVVASAADAEGESIESLSQQNDILNRTISELEKRLSAQQDMLDKAADKYGEADSKTQAWQRTVNATQTEINKLRSQINKNEQAMDDLANSTDDAGDSMDDLGDAADNSGGKLDAMTVAMGDLISSGIQACISAVGNLISSIWNLDEATEEYRIAQGRLNTAFEAAGMSTEAAETAYTEFYKILGDTDTATEASQLLAQLTENEQDLTTWTRIAAGVSGTFGDSLPIESLIEAANETANVGTVTGTLADALNWVGISEDEFNAKLAECSDASERNQLIMETLSGQYDEAADAFYENNDALVQARENQAAMDETLSNLGTTISNLKNSLLNEFAPAVTGVVDAFNALLSGQDGSQEQFATAIQGLITTVTTQLPNLINAGMQLLGALVQGLIQSIPTLLAAIPQIVMAFINGLIEQFPQILDSGLQVLNQLTTGIEQGIPDMLARIPEIIVQFLNYITGELPNILNTGVQLLNSFVNGILDAIPDMVAQLPEIITAYVNYITTALPEIIDSGIDLLMNFISGIIETIPELVSNLPQIINAIVNGIGDLMGSIIDIGKNIVHGVWQGISNAADWLWGKVKGFFSGIVDSVLGFLGIRSPSRVFAGIGENMAAGLGVGWDDQFGAIQKDVDKSMASLIPDTSANVSVTGRSGAASVPYDIAGAVNSALNGAIVYMDGRKVGKLITRSQNNDIRGAGLVPVS